MTAPNDERQPLQVLALTANPKPMNALLAALRRAGIEVDVASDLQAARSSFFGSGGHDCLVIAPDVRPGMVNKVVKSLGHVAPKLAMATFGANLSERAVIRTAQLGGFHPSSRAGQGALLRFLRNL